MPQFMSTSPARGLPMVVLAVAAVAMLGMIDATLADDPIPNLVGTWAGENKTISDKKGYKDWGTKTVLITEQQDRRFRGHFTYPAGTKNFFGIVHPDNMTFTWVASDSKGYNFGHILGPDRIAACYVEPGEEGTAGCADMTRQVAPQAAPQADPK